MYGDNVKLMGVDLGARKISWSIFVDNELVEVSHYEARTASNRATEIYDCVSAVRHHLSTSDQVVIEEPIVGRGVRASLTLAQTAGGVLAELGARPHVHPLLVPIDSWKMAVVGKGGVSKEQVATWLKTTHHEYYARCEGNQDRIDAVCIGLYACELTERARLLACGDPI